jgi:uncharacterized membrane protein
MPSDFPLQFDQPIWLFLLLLIVPVFLMSRRSIGGLSRTKAYVTFMVRVIVIALLTMALSHPRWEKRGEGLTVTVLLDRSQSIPLPLKKHSVDFLRKAAEAKDNREDRVAVITLAKDTAIAALPDQYSAVTAGQEPADLSATNLAAAVDLALAIMPPDTANRIVLASDGNETVESVLAAAEIAQANDIPIDVLLLEYEHANEVIFERIVAPARARQGQSASIKLVLRSQAEAAGTVLLSMNGAPLDLNGDEQGTGLRVELEPGVKVIPVTISLDEPGPQRFNAVFEPDAGADMIDRNNAAVAVTFVGGEGKVLVIDEGAGEADYLIEALQQSDINVEQEGPDGLTGGLVYLSGFDAVVLVNVARWALDDEQDRMLHAYVHDLGGGLVMIGGIESFGAGGWIDSEVAEVLPVKLDPPQTRQMPRGALALVMHSCEMPQGNYWGEKVAISAIEALSRLDYVGIIEFNWNRPQIGGLNASWAFELQVAGDKRAAIAAAKQMVVGDMPAFEDSMQLALNGLKTVRAGQKHVIIISDGDPSPPSDKLLKAYVDAKITVTCVRVAGHGPVATMKVVAAKTGGRYYDVKNPKDLPKIFIKEAQLVSRSLIQEDLYQPRVVSRLPGPTEGFIAVPSIDGYVLTAPRDGLSQIPIVVPTQEGNDPLHAHWNYGLGKSIAYTSDLTGLWGSRWVSWSEFRGFWEQSIRWVMRPSSPANMTVNTRLEGDIAVVEVEALEADASFMNFLRTSAVVLAPDSTAQPLALQQTGPGRYRGEFRTHDAGAYLVNVSYAGGSPESPMQGNLQAAVCVPYSREFRAVKHNAALLRELAERTGGRVLAGGSPELVDLFNREGLEVPKSHKSVWDLLAILAAALFVFDVAARRVSVDPRWAAAVAARAMGRRAEATTESVAAWKRSRARVAHRTEAEPAAERAGAKARFEADEADAKVSIDVAADAGRAAGDRPARVTRRPDRPQEPAEDEGDYTSRLLAAKRRARDQTEGSDAGGDDA